MRIVLGPQLDSSSLTTHIPCGVDIQTLSLQAVENTLPQIAAFGKSVIRIRPRATCCLQHPFSVGPPRSSLMDVGIMYEMSDSRPGPRCNVPQL